MSLHLANPVVMIATSFWAYCPAKDSGGGFVIQTQLTKDLDAILFDLDGTLCTYAMTTQEVLAQVLVQTDSPPTTFGAPERAADRYNQLWLELERGDETIDELRCIILARMLEEAGHPNAGLSEQLAAAYREVRDQSGTVLFEGVDTLISALSTRYKLGMLTNGPSELQWQKIDELELRHRFDAIVVAGDVGVYKPHPEVFEILLSKLDVDASRALYVGDWFEFDVVGGNAAGMRTVWVSDDPAPEGALAAGLQISRTAQLREVLL